jgi:uncharacterized oligopeptide transporter (OPT) family protein
MESSGPERGETFRRLPENANRELKPGEVYRPYTDPDSSPHEFTAKALFFGILFGILFGAANAYLGLRAGLTISTSIPVAVMTVAAFHALRRFGGSANILEANLSQGTFPVGASSFLAADDPAGHVGGVAGCIVHDSAAPIPDPA